MGNRRIGRKRLYAVEKKGKTIDPEAGSAMEDAISSCTQHRQGQEMITEFVVDLGTDTADLIAGTDDTKAIGVADATANYAYLTRLTVAKYGVITEIRVVCLEDCAAASNGTDVDVLTMSTEKMQSEAISGGETIFTGGGAVVKGREDLYTTNTNACENDYLYVVDGAGSASGAITGGKFAIYVHGYVVPGDLA